MFACIKLPWYLNTWKPFYRLNLDVSSFLYIPNSDSVGSLTNELSYNFINNLLWINLHLPGSIYKFFFKHIFLRKIHVHYTNFVYFCEYYFIALILNSTLILNMRVLRMEWEQIRSLSRASINSLWSHTMYS